MNVTLTPEQEAMVRDKIEPGRFQDAGEVVQEALRLMEEHDRLDHLRAAVAKGAEQIARGEGILYTPEVRADIRRASIELTRTGAQPKADVVP